MGEGSINKLYPENLENSPSLSWAQLVSLRNRYSTESVADSAVEEESNKKSSEKGLRLSDSCVKVCTLFLWYDQPNNMSQIFQ